jgi:hypothetical protein
VEQTIDDRHDRDEREAPRHRRAFARPASHARAIRPGPILASRGGSILPSVEERILAARSRLERLGIVDAAGALVSTTLPPDMTPESDGTLETG